MRRRYKRELLAFTGVACPASDGTVPPDAIWTAIAGWHRNAVPEGQARAQALYVRLCCACASLLGMQRSSSDKEHRLPIRPNGMCRGPRLHKRERDTAQTGAHCCGPPLQVPSSLRCSCSTGLWTCSWARRTSAHASAPRLMTQVQAMPRTRHCTHAAVDLGRKQLNGSPGPTEGQAAALGPQAANQWPIARGSAIRRHRASHMPTIRKTGCSRND